MTVDTASLAENAGAVQRRIAEACERAGRDPGEVTLVAVSKAMLAERVAAAHAAGLRHFGENRVQEGVAKIEALALPNMIWHLIGHLQTNKARPAARFFDVVQSIDSRRVADALSAEAVKLERTLDVMIEVNYAGEESKFGFAPSGVLEVLEAIATLPGLRVRGLMAIAPYVEEPEEVRPVFRGMRELSQRSRTRLGDPDVWHLSMGMTNDYMVAIEEGATIVRIGRAIFGERPAV